MIDNIFITVVYYENCKSVYPVIELYYEDDPDNRAILPNNTKKNIFDLKNVMVLNINTGAREIEPADEWFFPFLFYPIERFEIIYLIEKS